MSRTSQPTGAPGVMPALPTTQPPTRGVVPWRLATTRKVQLAVQDSQNLTTSPVAMSRVLEGTGFLASVDIDVQAVAAGNAAAVAYAQDAPWNVLSNVVFKDIGPDLINCTGYGLFLANLYGGYGYRTPTASTDTAVYQAVTGAVATGGSFRAVLKVPIAINPRNMIGILGNQDRAVKYELRTDIAPSGSVYTVAPTALPALTVNRFLNFCTVPAGQNDSGQPQEQIPPAYGVIHTLTELTSESNPVSAGISNHFLRSIGNTIRTVILVLRDSTGARVDTMLPSRITLRVGDDTIFSETGAHRRQTMYDRYGFDAPPGVLVYDFTQDFGRESGFELGDDWLATRNIANAQFECTYPTFANSPGTLKIITDSIVIPAGMDLSGLA